MSDEVPGWGVQLQTEVSHLQGAFEKHVDNERETHKDLFARTERPQWLVVWVMGVMGALIGGLSIWAVTH